MCICSKSSSTLLQNLRCNWWGFKSGFLCDIIWDFASHQLWLKYFWSKHSSSSLQLQITKYYGSGRNGGIIEREILWIFMPHSRVLGYQSHTHWYFAFWAHHYFFISILYPTIKNNNTISTEWRIYRDENLSNLKREFFHLLKLLISV